MKQKYETKISELGKYISYCTLSCDNYYLLYPNHNYLKNDYFYMTFFTGTHRRLQISHREFCDVIIIGQPTKIYHKNCVYFKR